MDRWTGGPGWYQPPRRRRTSVDHQDIAATSRRELRTDVLTVMQREVPVLSTVLRQDSQAVVDVASKSLCLALGR